MTKALEELRRSGEISCFGAGINHREMIRPLLDAADVDFLLIAKPFSLLSTEVINDEFIDCAKRDVGIIVGTAFASGILATGAVPGARFNYEIASEEILDKVRRIEDVCTGYGVPLPAVALQFLLGHPLTASIIPGALEADHIRQARAWLDVDIPNGLWGDLVRAGLLPDDVPLPDAS